MRNERTWTLAQKLVFFLGTLASIGVADARQAEPSGSVEVGFCNLPQERRARIAEEYGKNKGYRTEIESLSGVKKKCEELAEEKDNLEVPECTPESKLKATHIFGALMNIAGIPFKMKCNVERTCEEGQLKLGFFATDSAVNLEYCEKNDAASASSKSEL